MTLVNYSFAKQYPLYYDLIHLFDANAFNETDELKQVYWDIAQLVVKLVDEAKATGQVRSDLDPRTFAMCLWGATNGILQLAKVRATQLATDFQLTDVHLLDFFVETLIKGIRA